MDDTTDYGGWLEALEKRAIEKGEDRVNNICRKAIGRAARRLIEVEGKLAAALKEIEQWREHKRRHRCANSGDEDPHVIPESVLVEGREGPEC